MVNPTRKHLPRSEQSLRPDKFALARKLRREMTPAERVLWSYLRGQRFVGRWRRQHVIRGFITEFYCPALGIVIEVDGGIHATQVAEDLRREEALMALGLVIVRFTNEDILERLPDTLRHLRAVLEPLTRQTDGAQKYP